MMEKVFQKFISEVNEKQLFVEGVAIADEKKVLMEHRFVPDRPRDIYSHSKSYTSTAVGIALAEGKLSLDDKLADYFPEYVPENPQPELLKITLKHLLTMSSGFNHAYLMAADRRAGVGVPDYLAYMMSRHIEVEPGPKFLYSSADTYLAGRMVTKATGKFLDVYLYDKLFSRLGQGYPVWEKCPQGHPVAASGLYMKLTEMMKLGQLYLADGMWNGERLVESSWIREATGFQISPEAGGDVWKQGYGYQFWQPALPHAYSASGAYGQLTVVLPDSGLAVGIQCPEYGDWNLVKPVFYQLLLQL